MLEPLPEKPKRLISPRVWWQLGALILVSAVAAYVNSVFEQTKEQFLPESTILRSVFNVKQSGESGLYEILKKAGLNCFIWQSPYRLLNDAHGTLVIIEPVTSLQDYEVDQVLSWVRRGNRLLYIDQFRYKLMRHLLDKMNIVVSHEVDDDLSSEDSKVPTEGKDRAFENVRLLTFSASTRLGGGKPIVEDSKGDIFTIKHLGKGTVLLGTCPNITANVRLTDPVCWQNFQFIFNWLSTIPGAIYFDERCHGFSNSQNVFVFLSKGAAGLVYMQLCIMTGIAILSAAQRFGKKKELKITRKISNLEFINGLSNAYRRARASGAVLEIIMQNLRIRLCKAAGISPHEDNEKLVSSWQSTAGEDGGNLAQFLQDYDRALNKKTLTDAELLSLIRKVDQMQEKTQEMLTTR